MEELGNINARLKNINEEYAKVCENDRKDSTNAEENFKAYLKRKRGNIQEREMSMLKEVQDGVDKLSDQKIRKQLTTFIKDYAAVMQTIQSHPKDPLNMLEEVSSWLAGDHLSLRGLKTTHITLAEKAEEDMRWKTPEPQTKGSREDLTFDVQFEGMEWQELTTYLLNFAKENFAEVPEIARHITENVTETINVIKKIEQEMERMKTEITNKSTLIEKLQKSKSASEDGEAKGPSPSDLQLKKGSKNFAQPMKKGWSDVEERKAEPGTLATISLGGFSRDSIVPDEESTTKMEPAELQKLLRAHIGISINHIKTVSRELMRLRKAARRDIETIKSKEMDVHEVEQKLRELMGVVNPSSSQLPEVKKTDDAILLRSRAPGTHTCNYCECHKKTTKTTVVARADSTTNMEEVSKHCSRYLQMLGETEQVFQRAFHRLEDIMRELQLCQSNTMWKEGTLSELSMLNPANDNEILEQVSNAQDIPETTQDLIQHANNCFKLLRIFYKDLEFLIQLSGRCVAEVAEQEKPSRLAKDEILSSLQKGDSVKTKIDVMADALGSILKEVDKNAENQASQSKEEEKARKEALEAMREARSWLEKASQRAPFLQIKARGPEANDVICLKSLTTTNVIAPDVTRKDSHERGMRVDLAGDQDGERGEMSKGERLLVTRSPREGKNSTGKEQVFHDSVIHVPESCPSPTKDRIRRLSTIGVKEQKEKPTNGKEADGPKQTASKSRQSTNFVSSSAATSFMTTPESQVKGNREQSEVSESKAMPVDEGTAEAEVRQKDGKEEGNVDIKAEVKGQIGVLR
ncbi:hypothetical protein C0Q70_21052 [Pomacea canaliculata]|uniref:Uncharacterized protein n=1 Tax=Pomacea canaliculata TaxID=400727 RepID=A0A2T7NBF9_POMCA|nr:hypothetical protein C0Q70_21052 [Pomacea canaliculata]